MEHDVDEDRDYVVWVYNDDGEEEADVTVNITVWPVEDEDHDG